MEVLLSLGARAACRQSGFSALDDRDQNHDDPDHENDMNETADGVPADEA
jgi:hypothetical protein